MRGTHPYCPDPSPLLLCIQKKYSRIVQFFIKKADIKQFKSDWQLNRSVGKQSASKPSFDLFFYNMSVVSVVAYIVYFWGSVLFSFFFCPNSHTSEVWSICTLTKMQNNVPLLASLISPCCHAGIAICCLFILGFASQIHTLTTEMGWKEWWCISLVYFQRQ